MHFFCFFIANNAVFFEKKNILEKQDFQALLVNTFIAADGYIRQNSRFLRIDFKIQYLDIQKLLGRFDCIFVLPVELQTRWAIGGLLEVNIDRELAVKRWSKFKLILPKSLKWLRTQHVNNCKNNDQNGEKYIFFVFLQQIIPFFFEKKNILEKIGSLGIVG